jgi:hypothetical protein
LVVGNLIAEAIFQYPGGGTTLCALGVEDLAGGIVFDSDGYLLSFRVESPLSGDGYFFFGGDSAQPFGDIGPVLAADYEDCKKERDGDGVDDDSF